MKNTLLLLMCGITFFACKKKNIPQVTVAKVDSTQIYSYTQAIANLGIVTGKIYTLCRLDSSGNLIVYKNYPGDTIIFNYAGSITETKYQTWGMAGYIHTEYSPTFPVTITYDSMGIYSIQYLKGVQAVAAFDMILLEDLYPQSFGNPIGEMKNENGIVKFKFGTSFIMGFQL